MFDPEVQHMVLETVFRGVEHPLSTLNTPIHQYRGIKYASIPARFRQSKVFASYPPLVDASRYGPICPQVKNMNSFEETLFGLNDDDIPKQILKQNEFECLNLNITCPGGLSSQSRLPVMVWVHGGDDRGHGSNWVYDGGALVGKSILVGKPMILVTFNFRLGLFGFAAGPQLREDGHESIGNFGLRDQRTLLEWLHNYIADFGGDPTNITLFGESSGAFDIVCHLLSTLNETRPLFHRAIVQSAVFEYNVPDVAAAGCQLSRLMSTMHLSTISQLRAIDADQLVKFGRSLRVVDDGVFLRHDWKDFLSPEDAHKNHHHSLNLVVPKALSALRSHTHTPKPTGSAPSSSSTPGLRLPLFQPLLIGDCASDSMLWSTPISYWTSVAAVRRIKAVCQSLSKTNTIFHTYDISSYTDDQEIAEHILELVNDARIAWPTDCFAHNARREGGGVWRYVFDQEGPWSCIPHHAADLMYLFDNVPLPESSTRSIAGSSIQDNLAEADMFPESFSFEDDDEEDIKYSPIVRDDDAMSSEDDGWGVPSVASWSYSRVRDTMQEQWIAFAYGEAPFNEDKVFVFGPEGETGERSQSIFEGRRRRTLWKKAFEPLGMQVVHKMGVELSRGPPLRN
ncbi:Alpha/Beta hydrolase protein [Lentinula aciculospora]|uniref:Carboxylic ester hydrolase n=1 Tax=Lentinula aciculospora TaxID=153920 RepID=A0A9W9DGW0_9AGAR|nr:Alpha/Beta hydrolase protein [Lentinula aciculospora]